MSLATINHAYLAARYSRNDEMRGVRDVLATIAMIEVTSRWIDLHPDIVGDSSQSFRQDFLNEHPEKCTFTAQHDLEDIDRADTVISFAGEGGKGGRHVEFGYGLARGKRMILIGPRENVFHTLPGVEWWPDWSRFVMALGRDVGFAAARFGA